ncbi:MAG: hypothetical protein EA390_08845 [Balneolaceae bacterium]|nr:MAG: hypothetical protein EA390_08845 [Balneolaceae bacterium]
MKTTIITLSVLLFSLFLVEASANAQQTRDLQYFRSPDKTGLNVFETSKETDVEYDGFRIRIGGANTLQFQALENDAAGPELEPNFNLATSNLDIDVQLHRGLRMHLRTYLSSRNHTEAWVKGGYLQVDRLDFIQDGFLDNLMDKVTIKVGHMTLNYGDAHFRRSDNGQALYNPFVGNYIMDSFTNEVGGEVYYKDGGFLAMLGLSNSKTNQSTVKSNISTKPSLYGKLGYDTQVNPDLRVRLTGSFYRNPGSEAVRLYGGDLAGARYYNVEGTGTTTGRFNPDFTVSAFAPGGPIGGEATSFMINPFVKFQGLEFFGMFERTSGQRATETDSRSFTQWGAELLYRFGANESFYLGGRYNLVEGELANGNEIEITRYNIGGGWFLTNNVLTKVEYVNQSRDGFTGPLEGAGFSGVMVEAIISF